MKEVSDYRHMLLVHQDFDFGILPGQPDGTHDIEASQMRTEQKTSFATSHVIREQVESLYLDVKAVALTGEEIDTIKKRRREMMILPIEVTPADWAFQRSDQVGSDSLTGLPRTYQIIGTDRIEQGARGWTTYG